MKKNLLLSFAIIIISLLALTSVNVSAATYENLTYTISRNTVTITDCKTSATKVTIPEKIDGYPVTSIDGAAFKNCTILTSVNIPDTVTSIGNSAFYNCTSLTSVNIPDSVTSIGYDAFRDCTKLASINIPDSVTSIGNSAFSRCTSLASVTIPDSLTSIGSSAFRDCTSLTSVTLGNSVTSIGNSAFYNCTNLTKIYWNVVNVANFSSNSYIFYNAGTNGDGIDVIFSDDVEKIPAYAFYISYANYRPNIKSVTIGDSVTSIGYDAFRDCTSLTKIYWNAVNVADFSSNSYIFYNAGTNGDGIDVIFGDNVEKIPAYIFNTSSTDSRPNIKSITIGNSVTSIGNSAFYNCTNLTKIYWNAVNVANFSSNSYIFYNAGTNSDGIDIIFGDNVENIPAYAFYISSTDSRPNIKSVTIGNSVTSIGSSAFKDCTTLVSVTLGNSVTSIGNSAFSGCTSLASVNIPDSVTSIDNSAFSGCTKLSSITIPDSITSISYDAFYNTEYYNNNENWDEDLLYIGNYLINAKPDIEIAKIKDGIKVIADCTFYGCTAMMKITLPESITNIGASAFSGCNNLLKITIPEKVTRIENSTFRGCTRITSVNIPKNLTSIGANAFYGCNSISEIDIPSSVTSIGANAFYNCSSLNKVNIHDLSAWCRIEFANNASNPLSQAHYLYLNGEAIDTVTFPDGITEIGYTLYDCYNVKNIVLPETATTIQSNAFSNCKNLESITIPSNITTIGANAFYSCSKLNIVNIKNLSSWCNIQFEDEYSNPFKYARNLYLNGEPLTSLVISKDIEGLQDNTFLNCTNIKYVVIPKNLLYIKKNAFSGCSEIKYVFFEGSQELWDELLIYSGNESITNAKLICNASKKTYKFETNCETTLPDITAYMIDSAPSIQNVDKNFIGWFDNEDCNGEPVSFPYYGNKTTLYAAWSDKTGLTLDDALIINANQEYTVTTTESNQIIYYEFTPRLTGEYRFYSTGNLDTYGYLYNSNGQILTYNDNVEDNYNFYIKYNLTAGEKYYIGAMCYNTSGTFTLITETDCIESTKTVCITAVSGEKIFTCIPNYLPENSQVILSIYKDNKFVEMQHTPNKNETIYFVVNNDFDSAKVMVWDSFDSMKPICTAEVVE